MLQAGGIPTLAHLSALPISSTLVAKGGKVEYVLDSLTYTAQEQSPLGDGNFDDMHSEEYNKILRCDNDLAFAFVREKLGLDPRVRWGPYADFHGIARSIYDYSNEEDSGFDEEECLKRMYAGSLDEEMGDESDSDDRDEDEDEEMLDDDDPEDENEDSECDSM